MNASASNRGRTASCPRGAWRATIAVAVATLFAPGGVGADPIAMTYNVATSQNELRSVNPLTGQTIPLSGFKFDSGLWILGSLTVDSRGAALYTVSDANTLHRFSPVTGELLATIPLDTALQALRPRDANTLLGISYDAATGRNEIRSVNPATGRTSVLSTVTFDSGGWFSDSLDVDHAAGRFHVISAGQTLYEFDLGTGALLSTVRLGMTLYAARRRDATTLIGIGYDASTSQNQIWRVNRFTGQGSMLNSFTFDGGGWQMDTFVVDIVAGQFFVLSGAQSLYRFDLGTGQILGRMPVDVPIQALVLDAIRVPTIVDVAPVSGPIGGGTPITVTGTNLVSGRTTVTVGGVTATDVVVRSPIVLTATTPAGSVGAVDVEVATPVGTGEKTAAFTYTAQPPAWRLDFDQHGGTDLSVYRPSTGQWFVRRTSGGQWVRTFGAPGDQVVDGDFDGDGRRDPAVYRPASGTWFWLKSSTGFAQYDFRGWGVQALEDTPVPADYDGDGMTDPAVFRPHHGTWFILTSSSGHTESWNISWGTPGDQPVPGDYDGDGRADIAFYRPATGRWFILASSSDFTVALPPVTFGRPGDVPVRGDFDGDGRRDIAVYRPSTGTWFWLKSSAGNTSYDYRGFGVEASGDVPVPGDYDGDGKTDVCVYRPKYGMWFVLWSTMGHAFYSTYGWGTQTDVPLGGAR